MCTDTGLGAASAAPVAGLERQEEWAGQTIALETVEALSILTVCDNVVDMMLPDVGPAHRLPLAATGAVPHLLEAASLEEGKVSQRWGTGWRGGCGRAAGRREPGRRRRPRAAGCRARRRPRRAVR